MINNDADLSAVNIVLVKKNCKFDIIGKYLILYSHDANENFARSC